MSQKTWLYGAFGCSIAAASLAGLAIYHPDWPFTWCMSAGVVTFVLFFLYQPEFWYRRMSSVSLTLAAGLSALPSVHANLHVQNSYWLEFIISGSSPFYFVAASLVFAILDMRSGHLTKEAVVKSTRKNEQLGFVPIAAKECTQLQKNFLPEIRNEKNKVCIELNKLRKWQFAIPTIIVLTGFALWISADKPQWLSIPTIGLAVAIAAWLRNKFLECRRVLLVLWIASIVSCDRKQFELMGLLLRGEVTNGKFT